MSNKTQTTEAKKTETLTDEQVKAMAIERGLIKSVRSEGQEAFEGASSRLKALEAEIFGLLEQADFGGPVEVRFGIKRDGEQFLKAIRTRKEYAARDKKADPAPVVAPVAKPKKGKGKKG